MCAARMFLAVAQSWCESNGMPMFLNATYFSEPKIQTPLSVVIMRSPSPPPSLDRYSGCIICTSFFFKTSCYFSKDLTKLEMSRLSSLNSRTLCITFPSISGHHSMPSYSTLMSLTNSIQSLVSGQAVHALVLHDLPHYGTENGGSDAAR